MPHNVSLHDPERGACSENGGSVPNASWQAVYTKPNQELRAARELRQQGFSEWVPVETVRLANRTTVRRPAFPRYLLVQFDPAATPWHTINGTRGVDHLLVSAAGRPLSVPHHTIAELMRELAPGGVLHPPEPREMRRGDSGTILAGPFQSFAGVCTRSTRERVILLMTIFGRSSEAEFRRQDVELI